MLFFRLINSKAAQDETLLDKVLDDEQVSDEVIYKNSPMPCTGLDESFDLSAYLSIIIFRVA